MRNILIASTLQEEIKQKILCYVEDWEREIIHVKNDFNARRLAYKYRGLTFYYLDKEEPNGGYAVYTINDSNNCVEWKKKQWCVVATKINEKGEEDSWPFCIAEALHDGLFRYYHAKNNKMYEPVPNPRSKEPMHYNKKGNNNEFTAIDRYRKLLFEKFPEGVNIVGTGHKCGIYPNFCTNSKQELGLH